MSTAEALDITPAIEESRTQAARPTEPQTVVGWSKPLHRFIRAEPKSIGVTMLFLGGAMFIMGIPMRRDSSRNSTHILAPFWLGMLFMTNGILYILTEHSPSKKLVTASLALSIIATLGSLVAFLDFLITMLELKNEMFYTTYYGELNSTEMKWYNNHVYQIHMMEGMFLLHCIVGLIILIVMTAYARYALRSNKTRAVVIMHNQDQRQ